jgi:hypothetical protein
MINNTYSFLGVGGSVQAVAADIVLNNHILSITGCPSMDYRKINRTPGFVASVAEVLQVTEYTPVANNETTYSLVITQYVQSIGRLVQRTLTYVTPSAGATATSICDAFRAQLLTLTDLKLTGSGAATLILTAQTGAAVFTAQNIEPISSTISTTTPGVVSIGTYADLVADGIVGGAAGQVYSQITIDWTSVGGETNGMPNYSNQRHTLYVNQAAINFAAFSTRLGEVVNALQVGGAAVDANTLAIG